MSDTIQAAVIQGTLDKGPKVPLKDIPLFRLVWSEDLKEKRIATYREYSGDVFVREVEKMEETPKYNFLKDRWILEMWFPPEVAYTPEVPETKNGSYECIYVFEDANHNPLPLHPRVVEIVIDTYKNARTNSLIRQSRSKAALKAKEEKAFKQDLEVLNDEGPLVSQFHDQSAIILPGKEIKWQ